MYAYLDNLLGQFDPPYNRRSEMVHSLNFARPSDDDPNYERNLQLFRTAAGIYAAGSGKNRLNTGALDVICVTEAFMAYAKEITPSLDALKQMMGAFGYTPWQNRWVIGDESKLVAAFERRYAELSWFQTYQSNREDSRTLVVRRPVNVPKEYLWQVEEFEAAYELLALKMDSLWEPPSIPWFIVNMETVQTFNLIDDSGEFLRSILSAHGVPCDFVVENFGDDDTMDVLRSAFEARYEKLWVSYMTSFQREIARASITRTVRQDQAGRFFLDVSEPDLPMENSIYHADHGWNDEVNYLASFFRPLVKGFAGWNVTAVELEPQNPYEVKIFFEF